MSRKNKKLLEENTISRFMTLAGNGRHRRRFLKENIEEDLYEVGEEPMDAGVPEDEPGAGPPLPPEGDVGPEEPVDLGPEEPADLGPEDDLGDEAGGEGEEEVTVDEEDMEALRTVRDLLDSILSASDEGEEGAMPGEEEPLPEPELEPGPEVAEVPPGGEELGPPPVGPEEEEPAAIAESRRISSNQISELTNEVLRRVSARIINENLTR